jgi:hypothetical protein
MIDSYRRQFGVRLLFGAISQGSGVGGKETY